MEQMDIPIELYKSEDREKVFTYIFNTYSKRVYNYICYRINCHYTAEDLTSKVFEKVILNIDSYSQKKASFEIWVFAIARNVLNDYFRSLKRHKLFSLDMITDLISKQPSPEDKAIAEEATDKLLNCEETQYVEDGTDIEKIKINNLDAVLIDNKTINWQTDKCLYSVSSHDISAGQIKQIAESIK